MSHDSPPYAEYLRRWEQLTVNFLRAGYRRMLLRKGGLKNLFLGGSVITRKELEQLIADDWAEPPTQGEDYGLRAQMEVFYGQLTGEESFPPEVIWQRFQLSDFGFFVLGLGYFFKLNKKYQRIYGFLQDDISRVFPTLGLAAYLFEPYRPVSVAEAVALSSNPDTRDLFFCGAAEGEVYDWDIRLSNSMFAYMQACVLPPPFSHMTAPAAPGEAAREDLLHRLLERLDNAALGRTKLLLCLCGDSGSGRAFTVRTLAAVRGMHLLEVDTPALLASDEPEQTRARAEIFTCCLLQGCWLFLRDLPVDGPDGERGAALVKILCGRLPTVFLSCAGPGDLFYAPDTAVCREALEMPDAETSLRYWRIFSSLHPIEADLGSLASRYRLLPGGMMAALRCAALERAGSDVPISQAALERAIQQNSLSRLRSYATDIRLVYTWEDLKLHPAHKRLLREAIDRIQYQYRVMTEWGFDRKLAYGRGLSLLFYGPPGTGKTMGAQVVAKELGLRLYRIDLSQTVSKYIGETEKNLADIFERARYCNAVLLFDEADALFGKRTAVSDAKDKYANLETAYLLQKMEEHDGISILATNRVASFDDAFRRRISYMVEFPLPDEALRLELWESMLPPQAPTDRLDLPFLARRFPFTGSMIKNVVVSAAYLAAGKGGRITMEALVRAIRLESNKNGAAVWKHDFEHYQDLLDEESATTDAQ